MRENLTEGLLDYLTKRPLLLRVSLTVNTLRPLAGGTGVRTVLQGCPRPARELCRLS